MGAYSNPQVVVDTQSGQHWRNLQDQLTRTMENVGNSFAQAAKRNKEYGEIAEKNTENIRTITSKLDIKNPELNIVEATKPLIEKYNQLQNDIAFGRSKNIAEDRAVCSKIENMITETAEGIGDLASYGGKMKDYLKYQNTAGGMAPNNDPNAVGFGSILTNNAMGKVELKYDLDNYTVNFASFKAKKGEGDKVEYEPFFDLSTKKLKSYLDNGGGIKIIQPITPILENLKKNTTLFDEKGQLKDIFYTKGEKEINRVSRETITNNKLDKDTEVVYTQPTLTPDPKKIRPLIEQNVEATMAGLDATGDLQALYNFYVNPSKPIALNEKLTELQRAQTADFISQSLLNTLPTIDDQNSPKTTKQVTKQTEVPSTKTSGSGNKQKAADKQERINNIAEGLAGKVSGTIMESASGGEFVVIAEDGKMYPSNKQGKYDPAAQPLEGKALKLYLNYNK